MDAAAAAPPSGSSSSESGGGGKSATEPALRIISRAKVEVRSLADQSALGLVETVCCGNSSNCRMSWSGRR